MWQHPVVFLDTELDQSPDRRDVIERVQKQPLMLL
jgi:hypothetical protein